MLFIFFFFINVFSYIILYLKKHEIKYLIDIIVINFWYFRIFASIKDILKKKHNPMIDLSKFTYNKNILLSGIIALSYNQINL